MLYNFNGNLLNVTEIVSVKVSERQDVTHPHMLTVTLRNAQLFSVAFSNEAARRRVAREISYAFDQASPLSITRYEVETFINKYTEKKPQRHAQT